MTALIIILTLCIGFSLGVLFDQFTYPKPIWDDPKKLDKTNGESKKKSN